MTDREDRPPNSTASRLTGRGTSDDRCGDEAHADEDQYGAPRGHQGLQPTADAHSDQATGPTQSISTVVNAGAIPSDVEDAGHRHHGHDQPYGQSSGDLTELAALPEHGQAGSHHGHGEQDTCRAN